METSCLDTPESPSETEPPPLPMTPSLVSQPLPSPAPCPPLQQLAVTKSRASRLLARSRCPLGLRIRAERASRLDKENFQSRSVGRGQSVKRMESSTVNPRKNSSIMDDTPIPGSSTTLVSQILLRRDSGRYSQRGRRTMTTGMSKINEQNAVNDKAFRIPLQCQSVDLWRVALSTLAQSCATCSNTINTRPCFIDLSIFALPWCYNHC